MAETTTAPAPATATTSAPAAAPATAAAPAAPAPAPAAAAAAPAPAAEPTTVITEGPGDKAAEPAKADTAPTSYSLKVPEGAVVEPELLTGFTKAAQEAGISADQAQKVLDFYAQTEKGLAQKYVESQKAQSAKWVEEARQDKEIGGAKWDATVADAKKAITQLGSPSLKALLNQTGLGNHKDVIAFFAKAGRTLSEDRLPKGASAAGEVPEVVPVENKLYTTMFNTDGTPKST